MKARDSVLMLLLLLAATAGCQQDEDASDVGTDDSPGGSGPDTQELEELAGYYAEKSVVASLSSVPGIGQFQNTGTYYGLTEIRFEDGALVATSISCRSVLESTSPIKTSMDDAVVQSLPPFIGELAVESTGGALKLTREEVVMPLGVRLDDPWNDPLPTDKDDPRIWDQDEDGHPGISVDLKGMGLSGKVFAIRKERGYWSVVLQDDGRLVGQIFDSSEQEIIGATNPVLKVDIEDEPDPDPKKNTFELIPLGSKYDCDRLIAELDEIDFS